MEQDRSAQNIGANDAGVAAGHDYEYDEAHDAVLGQHGPTAAPHHVVSAPQGDLAAGGDYGYDEAHDFRAP